MAKRAEVNPNAVEAMRDLDCDLTGHQPRHVSAFQHLMFDFVAKMDTPDIERVRRMLAAE